MTTTHGSCSHNRPCGWLRSFVNADRGAIAVYVALVTPLLVGAAGLAVDVSGWYVTKRTMQNGADAAAFAAALDIAHQGLSQAPDLSSVQAAADDAASRNGLADVALVTGRRRGARLAVEGLGHDPCRGGFSDAASPGEEICVADPLGGIWLGTQMGLVRFNG